MILSTNLLATSSGNAKQMARGPELNPSVSVSNSLYFYGRTYNSLFYSEPIHSQVTLILLRFSWRQLFHKVYVSVHVASSCSSSYQFLPHTPSSALVSFMFAYYSLERPFNKKENPIHFRNELRRILKWPKWYGVILKLPW